MGPGTRPTRRATGLVVVLSVVLLAAGGAHALRWGGDLESEAYLSWEEGHVRAGSVLSLWAQERQPGLLWRADLDLSWTAAPEGGAGALAVRRLFGRYAWPGAHLTLGRQRIAWGVASMWSPLDVVNPPAPGGIFARTRPGVDGAQLRLPLGVLSYASLVAVEQDGEWRYGVRGRTHVGGVDGAVSYLSGTRTRPFMVGVEAKGDLLVGWYGEVRYQEGGQWAYVVGGDYSLAQGAVILQAEYYRNTAGAADVTDYDDERGWWGAERYAWLGVQYKPDDFTVWRLALVRNLVDDTWVMAPSWETVWSPAWSLGAGGAWFAGREGELAPARHGQGVVRVWTRYVF